MKTRLCITNMLIALCILASAVTVSAQPAPPEMDALGPLKAALESAGAPELTSDQVQAIQALLDKFRETDRMPPVNGDFETARQEYEYAILNADPDAAAEQAVVLANARAAEMAQREADAAVFAIDTIAILEKSPDQYTALVDHAGKKGLVHIVVGLFGGPGKGGHHGPGNGAPPPPDAPVPF